MAREKGKELVGISDSHEMGIAWMANVIFAMSFW